MFSAKIHHPASPQPFELLLAAVKTGVTGGIIFIKRNIMKILIDLDEVLAPLVDLLVEFLYKTHGIKTTKENFVTYSISDALKTSMEKEHELLEEFKSSDFYKNRAPFPQAVRGVKELKKMGHVLAVGTSRPSELSKEVRKWTDKNFQGIFYHVYIVHGHNASKFGIYEEFGAEISIDDRLSHIKECANLGIKPILYGDYPWNSGVLPDGAVRAVSWPDVVNEIKEINNGICKT